MTLLKNLFFMARRFKLETTLNFIGLTVAFAAFYLLMTQAVYEKTYNHCIPDGERVMRLETEMGTLSSRIMDVAVARMPQVESTSEFNIGTFVIKIESNGTEMEFTCKEAGLPGLEAIGAHCVDGKLWWDDQTDSSIIVPASLAQKLFGHADVSGQSLLLNGMQVKIRGVYEDLPDNCSVENYIYHPASTPINDFENWSNRLFVRLRTDVDASSFQKDFPELFKPFAWEAFKQATGMSEFTPEQETELSEQFELFYANYGFRLRPVRETWFSNVDSTDRGNSTVMFILELALVLIIVITTVNFHNFMLAESIMRIRSINTRRVLGDGVWSLRMSIVIEAVIMLLAAAAAALIVCILLASRLSVWLSANVLPVNHPGLVGVMAGIAIVMGFVAGAYPALFATSFEPAMVLRGSFGLTPRGRRLRSLLLGVQLGIAVFTVICTSVMLMQMNYIHKSDCGFDKDHIICIQLDDQQEQLKDTIRNEILKMDGVVCASYSRFMLGTQDNYVDWTFRNELEQGDDITLTCLYVDHSYLSTMGIKVTEGRDFNEHDSDCYIINEAARRQWPWVEVGKQLVNGDLPVIGICENIRYASIRKDFRQKPMAFVILGESYSDWGDQLGILNVRIDSEADIDAVQQRISELMDRLGSNEHCEVSLLSTKIEQLYQEELRFISLILFLSAVCMVITLLGVFCLTVFETEYRRKEIGIRKILGSSTAEVLRLLCQRYVWLLLISFIIAAPLAWFVAQQWLQSFVEHTAVSWWIFPLTFLVIGVVTIGTVAQLGWHTANENPVDSIKTE